MIAGFSKTAGDANTHAAIWWFGGIRDLGTLGGANSAVLWPVKNDLGVVSGVAQTDKPNPLNESWSCSAFIGYDGHACLGFVWAFGKMQALPPLPGGYNSFATGTNNRLQTVGWAETGYRDPTCNDHHDSDQVLQFLPVVWGPGPTRIRALPLLEGDSSGAATAINDRGDVVGISGECGQAVGRHTAKHMVLWKDGRAIDLGDIGGDAWNTPMAINRKGDITGFANVRPGAGFSAHAFYRDHRGGPPIDLGVLPGDSTSQGLGINNHGQVVGLSCGNGSGGCHAFLWQDGVMLDLDKLAPGHAGVLTNAQDINELGQITGQACATASSDPPCYTFRADPVPGSRGRRH
jgi:probable HAF family extracellular repeat protein